MSPKFMPRPKDYVKFEMHQLPIPVIDKEHWKVGDGMTEGEKKGEDRFIIAQIAVVMVNRRKGEFSIQFYDDEGKVRGSIDNLFLKAKEDTKVRGNDLNLTACTAHNDLRGRMCAVTGKTCTTQCYISE